MMTSDEGITLGEVARAVARIESHQALTEGKYVLTVDFQRLVAEVAGIHKMFGRVVWLLATNVAAVLVGVVTAVIVANIH